MCQAHQGSDQFSSQMSPVIPAMQIPAFAICIEGQNIVVAYSDGHIISYSTEQETSKLWENETNSRALKYMDLGCAHHAILVTTDSNIIMISVR